MQFLVRENDINGAEEKLRRQAGRQHELQTEMQSCLQELKKLAPMETECVLLISVIERMQEETHMQENMANALSAIMDLYRNSENRAVENIYNCEARRRMWDVGQIEIPVYNTGVIKRFESS